MKVIENVSFSKKYIEQLKSNLRCWAKFNQVSTGLCKPVQVSANMSKWALVSKHDAASTMNLEQVAVKQSIMSEKSSMINEVFEQVLQSRKSPYLAFMLWKVKPPLQQQGFEKRFLLGKHLLWIHSFWWGLFNNICIKAVLS